MKIYFTGAIAGGREYVDFYSSMVETLKQHGNVLTQHIGDKTLSSKGESLPPEEIFRRDVEWIKEVDVLIAEVTTPSLGVGYEIGVAEKLGKPILCLFHEDSDRRLSKMIAGNPNLKVKRYKHLKEVDEIFDLFFKQLINNISRT